MKTVWHWKNIGKSALLVVLTGVAVGIMQLPQTINFLVSVAVGCVSMLLSLVKWDLWHFE